eukprot:365554-Chlamydomonas_euryale.AAC.5
MALLTGLPNISPPVCSPTTCARQLWTACSCSQGKAPRRACCAPCTPCWRCAAGIASRGTIRRRRGNRRASGSRASAGAAFRTGSTGRARCAAPGLSPSFRGRETRGAAQSARRGAAAKRCGAAEVGAEAEAAARSTALPPSHPRFPLSCVASGLWHGNGQL